MAGAVDTTYTFTSTDVITSTKLNDILDQSVMTGTAIIGTTLEVTTSGKLKVASQGVTSNELANGAVNTIAIADGAVTQAKASNMLVPAGAVMAFAMNSAPTGWLTADGSSVSRTTYASLFTAIGTTYGSGDGATTFTLPDLRGYFVRGFGTNSDGTAAGTFGAKQAEMVGPHSHPNSVFEGYLPIGSGGWRYDHYQDGGDSEFKANLSTSNNTGTENRPKNIAMLYCIKY